MVIIQQKSKRRAASGRRQKSMHALVLEQHNSAPATVAREPSEPSFEFERYESGASTAGGSFATAEEAATRDVVDAYTVSASNLEHQLRQRSLEPNFRHESDALRASADAIAAQCERLRRLMPRLEAMPPASLAPGHASPVPATVTRRDTSWRSMRARREESLRALSSKPHDLIRGASGLHAGRRWILEPNQLVYWDVAIALTIARPGEGRLALRRERKRGGGEITDVGDPEERASQIGRDTEGEPSFSSRRRSTRASTTRT